ncbi:armadillo-type protein [Jimgerdemannia flammicorona]|uniref:Armadillo-type protein n=1 Tax=Jimgerdemannia flammicorona TaxID=994334 RepID=A0A433Q4G0_9FUNG|nr:armadillo-type protein [Jimgerdemannia flammicorona]
MAFLSGVLKSSLQLLSKDATTFPYTIGDKVDWYEGQSIWSLHHGTKREDGTPVSIFTFDCQKQRDSIPLAKNAFKKMRTIRHPDLLKYIDGFESDNVIHIVTETVEPVQNQLRQDPDANLTLWGLYKVATQTCRRLVPNLRNPHPVSPENSSFSTPQNAIKFLNADCGLVHGNIRLSSIFATKGGEWKLGGFELLGSPKEEGAVILTFGGLVPDSAKYASPETRKSGWSIIKDVPVHSTDSWLYACLVYESYNGPFSSSDQLTTRKDIPTNMFAAYKQLLAPGPASRADLGKFIDLGTRAGGFFQTDFLQVNLFLENLSMKEQKEKEGFYRKLDEVIEHFPMEFCKNKILPELINAFEYGSGGAKVLNPIVKIGAHLTDEEYERTITASLVKMFASADRGIRLSLLENLPRFVNHLGAKAVNDKIFPHVATGFTDGTPILREQTVKAILLLVPKLNERIINYDLLRYLAKLQMDEEPGIRTNATICLGKIARYLSDAVSLGAWMTGDYKSRMMASLGETACCIEHIYFRWVTVLWLQTRKKVLVPAFTRGLRDGFVHARVASLMALNATAEYYDALDCSTKIVPCVSLTLVDKEKWCLWAACSSKTRLIELLSWIRPVRVQAFKTIDMFIKRLEKLVESMPDTAIQEQQQPAPGTAATNGLTNPASTIPGTFPSAAASVAAGAAAVVGKEAASWAGWAVTSLTTRILVVLMSSEC